MKTEHRFAEALKNMMSEMPLEEISVAALTRRCRVNRQTFYYHFHDIYDLLALVFLNETIPGIDETRNSEEMATAIFNYYLKNERFIDETLNSAGKDLFVVKESFLSKIVKKIKNFFRKEEFEKEIDISKQRKKEIKEQFKNSIRTQGKNEILALKIKLEKGEIRAIDLTDEQIDELQSIYDKEIQEKKFRLNNAQ